MDAKSLHILGGRVETLAEAWEAQRKYGGTNRPMAAAATATPSTTATAATASASPAVDDGARAPPFRQFVPGRDERHHGGGASSALGTSGSPGGRGRGRGRGRESLFQGALAAAGVNPPGTGLDGTSGVVPNSVPSTSGSGGHQPGVNQPTTQVTNHTPEPRDVGIAPAQLVDAADAQQQRAAKMKLLEKLASREAEAGGRWGGRRGGRGGRRSRYRGNYDDDDEGGGGGMTLEEYEASKKAGTTGWCYISCSVFCC